jgi:hypothetical protein
VHSTARCCSSGFKTQLGKLNGRKSSQVRIKTSKDAAVFPGSSVVEQAVVNRQVDGSNPFSGANFFPSVELKITRSSSACARTAIC